IGPHPSRASASRMPRTGSRTTPTQSSPSLPRICMATDDSMTRRRRFTEPGLAVLFVTLVAGCGGDGGDSFAGPVYRNPAAPVEARVEDLLARMTLEEKVAQMHGVFSADPDQMNATPDDARLGIPGFHMIDGPRGVSISTGVATSFPVGSARGATFDPDLEAQVGEAIGAETHAKGYNVLLAPTINLLRHPRWGRAQETYGEDPVHVGAMAARFIRGATPHVIGNAKP